MEAAHGGAIVFIQTKHFQLYRCIFTNNTAIADGGALFCNTFVDGETKSCVFENNSATRGGAVCAHSKNWNTSTFDLNSSIFTGNRAAECGGALFVVINISLNILHCNFSRNVGPIASAVYFLSVKPSLRITESNFSRNSYGAKVLDKHLCGVIIVAQEGNNPVDVHISRAVLKKNNACGGVVLGNRNTVILNSVFYENNGLFGGAISTMEESVKLLVVNTSFVENSAEHGASMFLQNRNSFIQGCYFEKNMAFLVPGSIACNSRNIQLRFHNNTFLEPRSTYHLLSEMQTLIYLASTHSATMFFWETYYYLHSHKTLLVDETFLENVSLSKIVKHSDESISTEKIHCSQFASGE